MANWPYGEDEHAKLLTATEHMKEREHLDTVQAGAPATELGGEEETPTPFIVTIYFRGGWSRSFEVTKFNYDEAEREYVWEQRSAMPGAPLLQWVYWADVIMIETMSIEGP